MSPDNYQLQVPFNRYSVNVPATVVEVCDQGIQTTVVEHATTETQTTIVEHSTIGTQTNTTFSDIGGCK